jgi:hypothetical protein
VKSSLREMLEEIAHDAGVVGVIEGIPDHILEEASLDFLSCPVCAGDGEGPPHGHNPGTSLSDVIAAVRSPEGKRR